MVVDARQSPHREVTVSELAKMLHDGCAAVVDVREADEFAAGFGAWKSAGMPVEC